MKSSFLAFGLATGFLLSSNNFFAQEIQNVQIQQLSYHAEIPEENSYEIVKNLFNQTIPEEILLKINAYRRADEDYLWIVNEELEILIRKF